MNTGMRALLAYLRRLPAIRVVLLACLWVLGLRLLFVMQSDSTASLHWALVADAAAVVLILLLLPYLRHAAVATGLAVLIALIYFVGGEHVHTHGTLFRLAHAPLAADADFVSGTAIRSGTFLVAYLAWALAGLVWIGRAARRNPIRVESAGKRVTLIVALLVAYVAIAPNITHPANNVVLASLTQVPGAIWRTTPRESEPYLGIGQAERETDYFMLERAPPARAGRPNILMIVVEGLSGAYLPSVADHHGVETTLQLPQLERTLERHGFRTYYNMINLQRQTHRGTYPLLCGDYPRITTAIPKMVSIAERETPIRCLPAVLSEAGYHTLYFQAAELGFMYKDAFMPAVGFDVSIGREQLEARGLESGEWGPGDAAFYAAATDTLLQADEHRSPWFATLLNVGTHHPYTAGTDPETEMTRPDPTMRREAFDTMAASLTELLDRLDANGVLDDTLVLVVSDESGGVTSADGEVHPLGRNWGMLAVRAPGAAVREVLAPKERITAQIDVPVTILDALDLSGGVNMIGRSLLHHPAPMQRGLLFGDTYGARTYFLHESGHMLECGETVLRCSQWRFDPERLFGSLALAPDAESELGVAERLRLVADASIVRLLGAHEGEDLRHAPQLLEAGHVRRRSLPSDIARDGHVELGLRLRQLRNNASGGRLTVDIRARDANDRVARGSLTIEPGETELHRLRLTAPASAPLDIYLHWEPRDGTDPLALLELTAGPGAAD